MGRVLKVLFDINVVIAYLLEQVRSDDRLYLENVKAVWDANQGGEIKGYLAAFSLPMIFTQCEGHYTRVSPHPRPAQRKQQGRINAYKAVRLCMNSFEIVELIPDDIKLADQMVGKNPLCNDFEDNLQIACAVAYNLDLIVTDNLPDFHCARMYDITALTPTQLLTRI